MTSVGLAQARPNKRLNIVLAQYNIILHNTSNTMKNKRYNIDEKV